MSTRGCIGHVIHLKITDKVQWSLASASTLAKTDELVHWFGHMAALQIMFTYVHIHVYLYISNRHVKVKG